MGKYSFENFYVNANNKQAFFAARNAVSNPGRAANPVYIYGGSRTGKTHILYSIEEFLSENHPEMTIVHVSSETFVNDLIAAIKSRTESETRERYRNADVLLFDDIHFLAGKESTMGEFLHLFNCLYEADKQIVITGNKSPKELKRDGLTEELSSRLEWGRTVEIPSEMDIPQD